MFDIKFKIKCTKFYTEKKIKKFKNFNKKFYYLLYYIFKKRTRYILNFSKRIFLYKIKNNILLVSTSKKRLVTYNYNMRILNNINVLYFNYFYFLYNYKDYYFYNNLITKNLIFNTIKKKYYLFFLIYCYSL